MATCQEKNLAFNSLNKISNPSNGEPKNEGLPSSKNIKKLNSNLKKSFFLNEVSKCNCKYIETQLKLKEKETEKLRMNLQKCQNELREEVEKRGVSSWSRGASERDKEKLLGEIKQLGTSKKRLESALEATNTTLKRKNQEIRLVKEACRQEVAKVEKSTNLEIKRLLEELKTKNQMLASLDRNLFSDRTVQVKSFIQKQQQQIQQQFQQQQQQQKQNQNNMKKNNEDNELIQTLKKQINILEKELKNEGEEKEKLNLQTKILQNEKISLESKIEQMKKDNDKLMLNLNQLQEEVSKLNEGLASSNVDQMLSQFEELRNYSERQKKTIRKLEEKLINQKTVMELGKEENNIEKKTVRFMLPGLDKPVINGRIAYKNDMKFLFFDVSSDEEEEEDEDEFGTELSTYFNKHETIYEEDEEEENEKNEQEKEEKEEEKEEKFDSKCEDDVEKVEDENKNAEPIEQNENSDFKKLMNEHLKLEEKYRNLSNNFKEEWESEKESLNMTIITYEAKFSEYENIMKELSIKIEELNDKNEELEFQVLELEGQNNNYLIEMKDRESNCLRNLEEEKEKEVNIEDEVEKLRVSLESFHLTSPQPPQEKKIESLNEKDSKGESFTTQAEVETNVEEVLVKTLPPEESVVMATSATSSLTTISSSLEDFLTDDDQSSVASMPHDDIQETMTEIGESSSTTKSSSTSGWEGEQYQKLVKVVENLELRLASSKLKEKNLLDKIAIMCEEKQRIIKDYDSYLQTKDDFVLNDEEKEDEFENDDEDDNDDSAFINDHSLVSNEEVKVNLLTSSTEFIPHFHSSPENEESLQQQKIINLEKDCKVLKELVEMDDKDLQELQNKLNEVETNEKKLIRTMEKMEEEEEIMKKKQDELIEENKKLKLELNKSKGSEEGLQGQLDISKSDEVQMRRKWEEVTRDLRICEEKLRKKSQDYDSLKSVKEETNEKYEDNLGEMELLVEMYKKRNLNLGKLIEDYKEKLEKSEKKMVRYRQEAECMEQQRDTFVGRIQNLEKERSGLMGKINTTSALLEEKSNQMEMLEFELRGTRSCLQEVEEEKESLQNKIEDKKNAEIILMKEFEDLKFQNDHLSSTLHQIKTASSLKNPKHKESQTSLEDIFQDENSSDYNDEERLPNPLMMISSSSSSQSSSLPYDEKDDVKQIKLEVKFGKLKRSRSLNFIDCLITNKKLLVTREHKPTQTNSSYTNKMSKNYPLSLIPLHLSRFSSSLPFS